MENEIGERLAGAVIRRHAYEILISDVIVRAKDRCKGYGTKLMESVIREC
jgi:L-amino acid N-acyltransferase YncA